MKVIFAVMNISLLFTQNLFFSEYIEGSSFNKALEIFNPANNEIELTGWELWRIANGGDWTEGKSNAVNLSGFVIPASSVLVLCNSSIETEYASLCDLTGKNTTIFNGDDAIALTYNDIIIDVIGESGDDPGSGWDVAGETNATKDHTLIRKESIVMGNIDWPTSAGTSTDDSEWIVREQDDFTNFDSHTCSACGEETIGCDDNNACNFGNIEECTYPLETECDCNGNILDCNDICGGEAIIDACGVCDGPGAVLECGCFTIPEGFCDCNENSLDCNGDCGGTAELDDCGVCNGPGKIYTCGCTEIPDDNCDCEGNILDICGNCGGSIIDSTNCNLELKTVRPQNYKLINAYPNPFNSSTTISLQNIGNTFVKLEIIDLNGHIIDTIYSGYLTGLHSHTFLWEGTENNSGIYFAKISQINNILTHKIILLK